MTQSYINTSQHIEGVEIEWELDFYSRSSIYPGGRKKWELILCSTPVSLKSNPQASFRWEMSCPSNNVNSLWLKEALKQAMVFAQNQGFALPRRIRSWRSSMRTMIQRAVESFNVEFIPSRRCYTLVEWLEEREVPVYFVSTYSAKSESVETIYSALPAIPLPTAVRGDSWSWASLPVHALRTVYESDISFTSLIPLPTAISNDTLIPGVCLLSNERTLAIAAWIAGLEPVKLKILNSKLILETGLEDRWLLTDLSDEEANIAEAVFKESSINAFGLQFLAVQKDISHFDGLWMMRD